MAETASWDELQTLTKKLQDYVTEAVVEVALNKLPAWLDCLRQKTSSNFYDVVCEACDKLALKASRKLT